MKRKLALCVISILALSVFFGCAGMQQPKNQNEAYLIAITQYTNLQDIYLRNEARIEDPEVKDKIKNAFALSLASLDVWYSALESGGSTVEGEIAYERAIDIIINILPTVIEVIE